MVDKFHTTVAVGAIGTECDFAHTKTLEDGDREVGAELKAVLRKTADRVAPKSRVLVDQDAGRDFGDEVLFRRRVHVGSPTEAVSGEENTRVALRCGR